MMWKNPGTESISAGKRCLHPEFFRRNPCFQQRLSKGARGMCQLKYFKSISYPVFAGIQSFSLQDAPG